MMIMEENTSKVTVLVHVLEMSPSLRASYLFIIQSKVLNIIFFVVREIFALDKSLHYLVSFHQATTIFTLFKLFMQHIIKFHHIRLNKKKALRLT